MAITLYGTPFSRAFRCYWALSELELEFNHVNVDPRGAKDEKYKEMNPFGKIPFLEHDGKAIFESGAIVTYLGSLKPEMNLIPMPGTPEYAEYLQWAFFANDELEQPLWTISKHKFALPENLRTDSVNPSAVFEWKRAVKVVSKALEGKDYLLDDFSLADVLVGQVFFWASKVEEVSLDYPNINEYIERLKKRPKMPNPKNYT